MNTIAIIIYLIGIPITMLIDVRRDPAPRYEGLKRKSQAEFGFEVMSVALLWPIVLPFTLVWLLSRAVGWIAGDRER
jgi:hypothetical protein